MKLSPQEEKESGDGKKLEKRSSSPRPNSSVPDTSEEEKKTGSRNLCILFRLGSDKLVRKIMRKGWQMKCSWDDKDGGSI